MSVQEYKQQLFDAIQNLLWRQWTALGIPGHITVPDSEIILDPEALLIFSAGFARYDQRLYDLILDWLQIHSPQINIQRLKALYAKAEWKDSASLGYMAAVTAETSPGRWKKPADDYTAKDISAPVALFRDAEDKPEEFIPKNDPLALHCGFLRNHRRYSGKIPLEFPQNTASLLLRMRGILGISARVETILVLLTSGTCKIQDIVDRSGFCWKSIQDVLGELTAGNFVRSINGITKGKQYYLNNPEKLLQFFDIHTPVFASWTNIYDSLGQLWQTCSNPTLAEVSEATFQNELKNLYHDRILPKQVDSYHPAFQKTGMDLMNLPKIIPNL